MTTDFETTDRQLRAEADGILQAHGLHSLLSEVGAVHVTGSYLLQLMTWRDLDIYLVAEGLAVERFFWLGASIADLLEPARMSFRNERLARTPGLPDGLYWGVYVPWASAELWKLDIWGIAPAEYARLRDYCPRLIERLTPATRRAILEIKSQCSSRPGYRKAFTSTDIYEAVLDGGVRDLTGFVAYVRERKGCEIDGG